MDYVLILEYIFAVWAAVHCRGTRGSDRGIYRLCPEDFDQGIVYFSCSRTVGSQCKFVCREGFSKNPEAANMTCLETWRWETFPKSGISPCIPTDTTPCELPNGHLQDWCLDMKSCFYTCNSGYERNKAVKPTTSIVCVAGTWRKGYTMSYSSEPISVSLCVESRRCSRYIPGGELTISCSRRIGRYCLFTCNPTYVATTHGPIGCLSNGQWDRDIGNLCVQPDSSSEDSSSEEDSNHSTLIIVLLVVFGCVVAICVICCCVYKRKSNQPPVEEPESNLPLTTASQFTPTNHPADSVTSHISDQPTRPTAPPMPPTTGSSGDPRQLATAPPPDYDEVTENNARFPEAPPPAYEDALNYIKR